MSVCEEERFNNAFFLLKKTIEFLSTEYEMHFVILSAYQSMKTDSVVAYTSPGPAAKFFNDHHSTDFLSNWESFAKSHCFSAGSEAFANVPSYTAFLKSESSDSLGVKSQPLNLSPPPVTTSTEMPEPPSNILSETMYFCNGEFKSSDSEDSENSDCKQENQNPEEHSPNSQFRSLTNKSAVKRKSLQAVSDQLAKKAAVVNYYRPIYPAAPKIVTPSSNSNSDLANTVLNLSNGNGLIESSKPIINSVSSLLATHATYNNALKSASPNGRLSGGTKGDSPKKDIKQEHNTPSPRTFSGAKQTWPCSVCKKDFASQSTMKRHLNHFHLKVHSYTCNYCNDIFYRKDKLVAHIKIKHGIDTSRAANAAAKTMKTTSPNSGGGSVADPLSPVSSSMTSSSPVPSPGGANSPPSSSPMVQQAATVM